MAVPAPRHSFCGVQEHQIASGDPVKYTPNLCVGVGRQICRRGSPFGPAIEIEAKPVPADAAGAAFEWLYAAPDAKRAVVHVGPIGEVPDLFPWSAEKVYAAIAVIAARQQPRPGN